MNRCLARPRRRERLQNERGPGPKAAQPGSCGSFVSPSALSASWPFPNFAPEPAIHRKAPKSSATSAFRNVHRGIHAPIKDSHSRVFVDITHQAGLDKFHHHSGSPEKSTILGSSRLRRSHSPSWGFRSFVMRSMASHSRLIAGFSTRSIPAGFMLSSGVFDDLQLLGLIHIHAACQEVPVFQVIFPPRGYPALAYAQRSRGTSRLSRPSTGHAHLTPSPLRSPLVGCSICVHFKRFTG